MSTVRTHRARLVEGRWLLRGAILGATVSACFTAVFFFFPGSGLIPWRLWLLLWPTSIALMALQNPGPWTETALIWAIVGTSNIVVYVAVAAVLSVLSYPVRRSAR
jgi:hypothetical protein